MFIIERLRCAPDIGDVSKTTLSIFTSFSCEPDAAESIEALSCTGRIISLYLQRNLGELQVPSSMFRCISRLERGAHFIFWDEMYIHNAFFIKIYLYSLIVWYVLVADKSSRDLTKTLKSLVPPLTQQWLGEESSGQHEMVCLLLPVYNK